MNNDMYNELVEELLKIFDDRIISIILYGSVARGTDTPERRSVGCAF